MKSIPKSTLNNGQAIPGLGFGTWQIEEGSEVQDAVTVALDAGYRLIDTAKIYGNEAGVGRAVKNSGISREEVFITTKLWNADQGYAPSLKAFKASLRRLNTDYIDLYLIHWPATEDRLESWRALTDIQAGGQAKSIGVSNYTIRHLKELMAYSTVVPAVNQIEFHPFLYNDQKELLAFCKKHKILVQAYSPLAHGHRINDPVVDMIAEAKSKTQSQIILRWAIQHGTIPLPKSINPEHIYDNIDVFDFKLSTADMEAIDNLSDGTRTAWDPDTMA